MSALPVWFPAYRRNERKASQLDGNLLSSAAVPHSDPILIVGGGLGGLTAALAQRGHATRVLEGAPEFGAIGYGVQFGPNVFHVFDRFGVREEVLAVADAPPALLMLDALDGRELIRIPTGASFRARFKQPYIVVHPSTCIVFCSTSAGVTMRSSLSPKPW
jgi:salicylate hydroxylase